MISIDSKPINITDFPDGTCKLTYSIVELIGRVTSVPIDITWLYDNDSEIFQLACCVDWLKSKGFCNINLNMPYVPNARMDRTQKAFEMFTLKTFANLINNMEFRKVFTLDIHSNVGAALINNIRDSSPADILRDNIIDEKISRKDLVLFFPDEGAMKRYSFMSSILEVPYVFGMKNRDWKTGTINGLSIMGNTDTLKGRNVLIVDDICSKGGTFYYSAKALKEYGVGDIYLYVSHLENSVHDGDMIKSGLIKKIFSTNSIYRKKIGADGLEVNADKIEIFDMF